jgi:hypothetical protein
MPKKNETYATAYASGCRVDNAIRAGIHSKLHWKERNMRKESRRVVMQNCNYKYLSQTYQCIGCRLHGFDSSHNKQFRNTACWSAWAVPLAYYLSHLAS